MNVPCISKGAGGEAQRGGTVHCIPMLRRKNNRFLCNIHAQRASLGALHTYAPAQAMVQAEGLLVMFTILEESGRVSFTSDGDEVGTYDIHGELATVIMTIRWVMSSA